MHRFRRLLLFPRFDCQVQEFSDGIFGVVSSGIVRTVELNCGTAAVAVYCSWTIVLQCYDRLAWRWWYLVCARMKLELACLVNLNFRNAGTTGAQYF